MEPCGRNVAGMWLIPMGLAAGVLTTVAGMGGGMMMVLLLSLVWDAPTALAVTSPALFFGNVHRAWLYRTEIDWRVTMIFAAGAVPAALMGGVIAAEVPPALLHGLMLGTTILAVLRTAGLIAWKPPPAALLPAGFFVGVLAATSGAGAVLVAPVIMATGLLGDRYIATVASAAIALHTGRIAGYSVAGLFDAETLQRSAILAVAIFAGNLVGQRIRRGMSDRVGRTIEVAALSACTVLALVGVAP